MIVRLWLGTQPLRFDDGALLPTSTAGVKFRDKI